MDSFRSFILFPELFNHVDNLIETYKSQTNSSIPMEVISGQSHYKVRASVAGMDPDKLSIKVNGKILTISGEFKSANLLEDDETVLLNEMCQNQTSRQITLPESIDSDKVQADLKDGILELYLPKAEPSNGKTIKINKSDNQ